jgi:PHD/YefM family antitoxin component YafN of YafNO toxin-antitoxin module
MNIEKYTIEELIQLKNVITTRINNYKDGYLYICDVRSYGRNRYDESIYNEHTLQELCYEYFGEDGIVDVYSTNPNLGHIDNYGDVMYIVSEEDYEKWKHHQYLLKRIPEIQKELDDWVNQRPHFQPIYTKDDLDKMKKDLEDYDMSFTPPISYSDKI